MISKRSSGILAHITSLPSPYGIGDLGYSSQKFLSFLKKSEQTYWQFLPTVPTSSIFDHSPYMSNSAFAGNPLLLSPDLLFEAGLITRATLNEYPELSPYRTEFKEVKRHKELLLQKAFKNFLPAKKSGLEKFREENEWLSDYTLFKVAKDLYQSTAWSDWPTGIARRTNSYLVELKNSHRQRIEYYEFEQYEYFRQWQLLKQEATRQDIQLFGDLPIYVGYDSVDVWANQNIFQLSKLTHRPTHVAGVPPDYFSKTGQRWGNPLYDWQNSSPIIKEQLLGWWTKRLQHLFTQVDVARIDHFRGFESYWSIPEENDTAVDGEWLKGPGISFFQEIQKRLGPMNIVAEDLGIITEEVATLRDKLQFPGMKVLQFAFDGNLQNEFLPFNFKDPNSIVYTGTHDNDTTLGWFLSDQLNDKLRRDIKKQVNGDLNDYKKIHHDLIYLAQSSISKLCIFPLQDVLGFGNDCKMNSPGVPTGNWRWRCGEEFLAEEISNYLRETTISFGRGRKKLNK